MLPVSPRQAPEGRDQPLFSPPRLNSPEIRGPGTN